MNDFTKEELDEIFWIIEDCTMDYIGKENNVLIYKIQSMIDNYCEHDWVHSYREKEYELCSKCGEES
jgi:hypothetical protein